MNKTYFYIALLLCLSSSLIAQRTTIPCGTNKLDTAALYNAISYERNPANAQRLQATTRMVNVFIHILCDNNAGNQGATLQEAYDEFNDLINDYAGDNICFFLAGIDSIQDTHLNSNFNADTDPNSDWDDVRVPGCINIFFVHSIGGTNTACNPPCGYGGIALGGIPGNYCLVDDGSIGNHTTSHEVGHCLGLSHTFANINGRECINHSNGSSAGDLVIDTNADPYSWNESSCYSETSSGCAYTGNCTDPCGASLYSPPYTNIMSYWKNCYSGLSFTPGQFGRVNGFLDTDIGLLMCQAVSTGNYSIPVTNVSSGTFIRTSIGTMTNSSTVNISGETYSVLGGSHVTLTPGFRTFPSGEGTTIIRVRPCQ